MIHGNHITAFYARINDAINSNREIRIELGPTYLREYNIIMNNYLVYIYFHKNIL